MRVQGPVRGGPVCHAKLGGDSVLREDDRVGKNSLLPNNFSFWVTWVAKSFLKLERSPRVGLESL